MTFYNFSKATVDTGATEIVKGHVTREDAAAINGTVAVDISFDEPLPPGARPDQSVDGTIEIENMTNVLYIQRPVHGEPNSTVGLFKVLNEGADAERVQVKLGRGSVSTMEILGGLKEGDVVLLNDMSNYDNVDRIHLFTKSCSSKIARRRVEKRERSRPDLVRGNHGNVLAGFPLRRANAREEAQLSRRSQFLAAHAGNWREHHNLHTRQSSFPAVGSN